MEYGVLGMSGGGCLVSTVRFYQSLAKGRLAPSLFRACLSLLSQARNRLGASLSKESI